MRGKVENVELCNFILVHRPTAVHIQYAMMSVTSAAAWRILLKIVGSLLRFLRFDPEQVTYVTGPKGHGSEVPVTAENDRVTY